MPSSMGVVGFLQGREKEIRGWQCILPPPPKPTGAPEPAPESRGQSLGGRGSLQCCCQHSPDTARRLK